VGHQLASSAPVQVYVTFSVSPFDIAFDDGKFETQYIVPPPAESFFVEAAVPPPTMPDPCTVTVPLMLKEAGEPEFETL